VTQNTNGEVQVTITTEQGNENIKMPSQTLSASISSETFEEKEAKDTEENLSQYYEAEGKYNQAEGNEDLSEYYKAKEDEDIEPNYTTDYFKDTTDYFKEETQKSKIKDATNTNTNIFINNPEFETKVNKLFQKYEMKLSFSDLEDGFNGLNKENFSKNDPLLSIIEKFQKNKQNNKIGFQLAAYKSMPEDDDINDINGEDIETDNPNRIGQAIKIKTNDTKENDNSSHLIKLQGFKNDFISIIYNDSLESILKIKDIFKPYIESKKEDEKKAMSYLKNNNKMALLSSGIDKERDFHNNRSKDSQFNEDKTKFLNKHNLEKSLNSITDNLSKLKNRNDLAFNEIYEYNIVLRKKLHQLELNVLLIQNFEKENYQESIKIHGENLTKNDLQKNILVIQDEIQEFAKNLDNFIENNNYYSLEKHINDKSKNISTDKQIETLSKLKETAEELNKFKLKPSLVNFDDTIKLIKNDKSEKDADKNTKIKELKEYSNNFKKLIKLYTSLLHEYNKAKSKNVSNEIMSVFEDDLDDLGKNLNESRSLINSIIEETNEYEKNKYEIVKNFEELKKIKKEINKLQGNNEHGERIGSNKDAKAVFAKAQDPKSQTKISDLQEKFNKILDVIKKNTLYQKNFGSSTSLEKEEIIINYNELRNIDYAINKIVEEKPNSIKTIKDAALKCDKLTEELKKSKIYT